MSGDAGRIIESILRFDISCALVLRTVCSKSERGAMCKAIVVGVPLGALWAIMHVAAVPKH